MPSLSLANQLQGLHFEVGSDAERITILTSAPLKQKHLFMLENPDRMVLDFDKFSAANASLPETYRGKIIKRIRTGSYDAFTTRMVFDVTAPVRVLATYTVAPDGTLWRYVVDIALKKQNTEKSDLPSKKVGGQHIKPEQIRAQTKKKIAIDAGHGGQDPGAKGKLLREKDVTLRAAKAVVTALNKTGHYDAFLVRSEDKFIALHDRVSIARKQNADAFISIHADSNPNHTASGLSLYTLSETASDAEAEALAARENKSDIIDGIDLGNAEADVADILIELTQRETMAKSAELADKILKSTPRDIALLKRPHRYAGFRVLKAPDIPSVLIELGFLSNKRDEQRLASSAYISKIAAGVSRGLDSYFAAKK